MVAAEASAIVDAVESSEEDEDEEETQKPAGRVADQSHGTAVADDEEAVMDEVEKSVLSENTDEDQSYERLDEPAEYDSAVVKRIAAIGEDASSGRALVRRTDVQPPPIMPPWLTSLVGLTLAVLISMLGSYKMESSSIGWCDTGKNTNSILAEREVARAVKYECAERLYLNATLGAVGMLESGEGTTVAGRQDVMEGLMGGECTPLPLLPLPYPTTCTPCPEHAVCSPPYQIICAPTYILKPHPLAAIPGLRELASGLPGFGAVAFPPQCVEDDARKRKVSGVAKGMASYLENVKGERICEGVSVGGKVTDGGEPKKFGMRVQELSDLVLENIKVWEHTKARFVGTNWGRDISGPQHTRKTSRIYSVPQWTTWRNTGGSNVVLTRSMCDCFIRTAKH
jgi:hypothetical protein